MGVQSLTNNFNLIFSITKIKQNNVDSILDCSWEILAIMFGVAMD